MLRTRPTLPPVPPIGLPAWMAAMRRVLSCDLSSKGCAPLKMDIGDLHFYLYDEDGDLN